jgi:hypothetical protein
MSTAGITRLVHDVRQISGRPSGLLCGVLLVASGCSGADQRATSATLGLPSTIVVEITDPVVAETIAVVESTPPASPECAIGYEGYLAIMGSLNAEDPAILTGLERDFARVRAALPDSIIGELDVVAAAVTDYASVLAISDDPTEDPAVIEALATLDSRTVTDARAQLEGFFSESCVSV